MKTLKSHKFDTNRIDPPYCICTIVHTIVAGAEVVAVHIVQVGPRGVHIVVQQSSQVRSTLVVSI